MDKCPFEVGDPLMVVSQSYGWGDLKPGDIVTVYKIDTYKAKIRIRVNHPNHIDWKGSLQDFLPLTHNKSFKEFLYRK